MLRTAYIPAGQRPEPLARRADQEPASVGTLEQFFWWLLVFSLPFDDIEIPKALRGFGQPSTYLALLLCGLVLLRILLRKADLRFLKSRPVLLMFLFWVVAGISITQSPKAPPSPWFTLSSPLRTSLEQFLMLTVCLSVAFLTVFFVRSWRDFRFAMSAYFAGWVGAMGAQFIDVAAYLDVNSGLLKTIEGLIHHTPWWQFLGPIPRLRLAGAEASWASDYLLCLIPFFVLRAYYWRGRAWNAVSAILSGLAMFGTMSFGGIAVFLGEAALMAIALGRRAVAFVVALGAVPLVLALLISPIYMTWVWNRAVGVFDYGIETSDFSVRHRAAVTEAAWYAFQEHPWLGVGVGASAFYTPSEMPTWAAEDPDVSKAMNTAAGANVFNFDVQILSETGLVGAGLFVALLVTMALGLFRAYRRAPERWKKAVYAAILIALLGQVAHYVSMNRFFCHYWYFVWGLAIGVPRLLNQKDPMMPAHVKPRQIKMVLRPDCSLTGASVQGPEHHGSSGQGRL